MGGGGRGGKKRGSVRKISLVGAETGPGAIKVRAGGSPSPSPACCRQDKVACGVVVGVGRAGQKWRCYLKLSRFVLRAIIVTIIISLFCWVDNFVDMLLAMCCLFTMTNLKDPKQDLASSYHLCCFTLLPPHLPYKRECCSHPQLTTAQVVGEGRHQARGPGQRCLAHTHLRALQGGIRVMQ